MLGLVRPAGIWMINSSLDWDKWKEWLTAPNLLWVNNVACAEHLLSPWEPGILLCARQRGSTWPGPIKSLNMEPRRNFPARSHFTCVVKVLAGRSKCAFFWVQLHRRGLSEACVWLPLARDALQRWLPLQSMWMGGMAIQWGEFPEGVAGAAREDRTDRAQNKGGQSWSVRVTAVSTTRPATSIHWLLHWIKW